ncbi:MAG: hypothetical protein LH679_10025, partial [Cyanobacteria bacterium CAN_BIN43]|nr:hypothetical protein [Cyanobacteria bacterium CAN_BIN43]
DEPLRGEEICPQADDSNPIKVLRDRVIGTQLNGCQNSELLKVSSVATHGTIQFKSNCSKSIQLE